VLLAKLRGRGQAVAPRAVGEVEGNKKPRSRQRLGREPGADGGVLGACRASAGSRATSYLARAVARSQAREDQLHKADSAFIAS